MVKGRELAENYPAVCPGGTCQASLLKSGFSRMGSSGWARIPYQGAGGGMFLL